MVRFALARVSRKVCRLAARFALPIAAVFAIALNVTHTSAQEIRKWKDSSGKFEIEARFVSFSKGVVTLEEADGSTLEIELDKLSASDRAYVTKEAANPFRKKAAVSPFMKKSPGATSPRGDDSASGAGHLVKPSWDGVETIAATPSNTEWKLTVGSVKPPDPTARLRPAPIPPKADFFEGPKGVVVNGAGTRAVVGYAGARPGHNQNGASRVILCDLENGKMLGVGAQAGLYRPLALNDEGTEVLMRTDRFGPGGGAQLEFWNLGKSGVTKGDCWEPYEAATGANGGNRDVRWAAFLDAKRFATASEGGSLVIWQAEPLKPLATMQIQSGCTPALSPDRKFLAFATAKEIGLFDVAANEVLCLQPAPMTNMAWTSFAFSPSGKRLACQVFISKLFVYDVANGAQFREVTLQGVNGQVPTVFTDEDHILIGGQTLVDLESQVRLWTYRGAERALSINGVCYFEVSAQQNQAGGLIPARIPQKGVQDTLERAMRDPNFFIVKSGTSVALDVSGIPDAAQQGTVAQALTQNLAKIGVKVAANAPVTVKASIEPGKEQQIAYRTIGRGFGVERFTVHPQIGRVKYLYEGKTAWEASASTLPFFEMARLKKDESLQDHVRKFEKPNYGYFGKLELPKLLTRPTGANNGTLGVSQVTVAGVR